MMHMMFLCQTIPVATNNSGIGISASDLLAIISIILGILSIVLSIIFYVQAGKLTTATNVALKKIDDSTERLEKLSDEYINVVFQMFKNTHEKMTEKTLGGDAPIAGGADPKEQIKS